MGNIIEPEIKKTELNSNKNNMVNQKGNKNMIADNQKEKKKINVDNQKGMKKLNVDNQKEKKKLKNQMEKKNMNIDSQIGMTNMNMDNMKEKKKGMISMNMGYPAEMINMNNIHPTSLMNMNMGYPSDFMNMNMDYPMGMMNMNMGYPTDFMNMNMGYPMGMMNMNIDNQMRVNNMNNQMERENMNLDYKMEIDDEQKKIQNVLKIYGYEIIKYIYRTNYGKLFLISHTLNKNKKNIYFLKKIEMKSKEEKKKIQKEIDKLKKIDSKYIIKIIEHYFFSEKGKEFALIILNYYEKNLFNIIYESNFLNSRNSWKIFIQIVLGLNSLNLNNIIPVNLIPQNIYIDNENNIKIGGINMLLDFTNEYIQESLVIPYYSPEIIKEEANDEKSIIWSMGCILYELAFKKPAFWGKDTEKIKDNILKINYNLPNECEKELFIILQTLICEKTKRLTIKELIFEEAFKKKIIEVNLFSEIVKDNAKDFNNYFSIDFELFDEKDSINKFRLIESNEFPFYLICKKCYNNPLIELKDNEIVLISCLKCNINENERIENIVNCSSKYVSNAIKFCDSNHEEKTPSNIYCKTHNLFLCQDCFNNHKNEVHIGNDIIQIKFFLGSITNLVISISKKITINELLKIFMENNNLPENLMGKTIFFLFSGNSIDVKSQKTLEEFGFQYDNSIIVLDQGNDIGIYSITFFQESFWINNHNFIRLNKFKNNICIFHNKNLILNCIECNMEICDECKISHKKHLLKKIDNKNINLKDDYMEFENIIKNNENKKRKILKKLQENITWIESCNGINKYELNKISKELLTNFYKDLEKGQNLLFFSKILFDSFIRMRKEDDKKKKYKSIINLANQFYSEEKIKKYNLNNFPIINEYKDKCKYIYESDYKFIPQIQLKFNDVEEIDEEILVSLKEKLKELFNGKDVAIIGIKKGSLSACIALNYLIKEKLESIDKENKKYNEIIKELNEFLELKTKSIKDLLKNKLYIAQKDKQFKPDLAQENLFDFESNPDELVKCIAEQKCSKDSINIYEFSKNINIKTIKNFFKSKTDKTKETQNNLYEAFLGCYNEVKDYTNIFDVNFGDALKTSIFEYKVKYIAFFYRNKENYNARQSQCNNIEKKMLFHGTNSNCISRILADHFNESTKHLFGPGFYFSDSLDYTWFYSNDSNKEHNRINFRKIPEINDTFSFIVAEVYYDKDKFEQVYDISKKNTKVPEFGIRHILVDYKTRAIPEKELDNYSKFIGTEYLISSRNQILPLLSITVERVKYLIVWRDNNFNDSNPSNYSRFSRMLEFNRGIQNFANTNLNTKIYYFDESDEALKFIKRKKYNKIILITNGANNGEIFINNARKIIGNNTLALITCYNAKNYMKTVEKMENVLLNSRHHNCMKKFLSIVCDEDLNEIKNFQKEIEKKYQELDNSFHFKEINENAFDFPNFKESGKFNEIDF